MVTKLGQLACGNHGESTLTASKLDGGSVVIELGESQRWAIGPTDTLRVTGRVFGDDRVACMESFLMLNDVEITHFEINSQWGGTIIGEVAAFACAIAAASGCSVTVIDPPPEPMPAAPEPAAPPPAPQMPKVVVPVRTGADVLASLATSVNEEGLVRVLRLADGAIVLEDAFTAVAWTIRPSDELLLTVWGLSPGPPGRTTITLSRGDEKLASFYVWDDPTRGLHQAQVVELVKKIADLAACRVCVNERWD